MIRKRAGRSGSGRGMGILRLVAMLLSGVLIAGCGGEPDQAGPTPASGPPSLGSAQRQGCPEGTPTGVTCAKVVVTGGTAVEVAYIVAPGAAKAAEPVVVMREGLGEVRDGDLSDWRSAARVLQRDVIRVTFPGRGEGACGLLDPRLFLQRSWGSVEQDEVYAVAANGCIDELRSNAQERILTGTDADAQMLAEVQDALAVERWLVWGAERSLDVAIAHAAARPDAVAGLIAENPLEADRPRRVLGSAERADAVLGHVMGACREDQTCRAIAADLPSAWTQAMARVRATPVTLNDLDREGRTVAVRVSEASLGPALLDALQIGTPLSEIARAVVSDFGEGRFQAAADWRARALPSPGEESPVAGWTTVCGEWMHGVPPEVWRDARGDAGPWVELFTPFGSPDACSRWPLPPSPRSDDPAPAIEGPLLTIGWLTDPDLSVASQERIEGWGDGSRLQFGSPADPQLRRDCAVRGVAAFLRNGSVNVPEGCGVPG